MAGSSDSRVYVLGAGCSYGEQHGYPLAEHFVSALNAYAAKIAGVPECQRIKSAVQDTATLLTQCQSGACHASTIDQLINLIWNNRCDDQLRALNPHSTADADGLRYDAVRKAKIATAACFLEREGAALHHQVGKYQDFIQRKVLDETGVILPCQTRLQRSSARVLSFNYDRLFELCFFATFADAYMKRFSPYQAEALNSGMNWSGEIAEIAKDRFCFVKLHGSVGTLCAEDPFGQNVRHIGDVANWKEQKVTDALFFPDKLASRFQPEPMIVFPYEKDFIVSGRNNQFPFRSYIEKVWAHAAHVLQEASEVWVIGYSFDPTDCNYLIQRVKQARNCQRIIIQNLPAECNRIAALLKTDYKIQVPIEKYIVPF
ncbi:MAG: hypothetical protein ABSF95_01030 [Verrucomicrobiota bacterium]|jgi:hypothetical protein